MLQFPSKLKIFIVKLSCNLLEGKIVAFSKKIKHTSRAAVESSNENSGALINQAAQNSGADNQSENNTTLASLTDRKSAKIKTSKQTAKSKSNAAVAKSSAQSETSLDITAAQSENEVDNVASQAETAFDNSNAQTVLAHSNIDNKIATQPTGTSLDVAAAQSKNEVDAVAASSESSVDFAASQAETLTDGVTDVAEQITEIAQAEASSLAENIAQTECNGGSCSVGDKKSDKPNKKKKHIWLKRLISVGLVLILGIFSGSILANWYKRTIEASKFDYTQFDITKFYDDTNAIVASATGMSNPSEADMKNFAVLAKSSGKTPLNFTPSQNYILAEYNAINSSSFSAVGTGKVATIATQTIYTRKLYDGNAYTNENISIGLLTVATCSHYEKGGRVVRLVNGTNATDTSATWNGGEERYGTEEFVDMTGCLPNTILPYIISSKTILDEDKVVISQTERDGKTVYEFTISLHNVYSVLNYQKQVKFTSGLADSPVFSDISVKIIIDENWNFVRTEIVEHYTVIYGITANCEGTLNTDYTFNEPVELPIK